MLTRNYRNTAALPATLVLIASLACARGGADGQPRLGGIALHLVTDRVEAPVWLTSPPGDPRLFVVEQEGRIRVIKGGRLLDRPFLDIARNIASGGERGLLSVAFHPDYARNGLLFVNYTDRGGDTRIERYRVSDDPDRADPASAHLLLAIEQPYSNHNGGLVMFGPDGKLWIGMGDGGSGGDPGNRAQNPRELLGKLLRIDVDRGDPYGIPSDNPFADGRQGRAEIWALGLRNPWRFAFDQDRVYIADVGQNRWEEVHVEDARTPGLDYGWRQREGRHSNKAGAPGVPGARRVEPVLEYGHDDGCSITGGFVYRGRAVPSLVGHYVYADYCSGWIRSFRMNGDAVTDPRTWDVPNIPAITSFGQDAHGELYVLSGHGEVYRIEPAAR
jgi:glucose/arabinose dehydrogenase